jgi:hypothetical protein
MHTLSDRDILAFVAGALALLGVRALLWLPHYALAAIDSPRWYTNVFYSCAAGINLPLGISILLGWRPGVLVGKVWIAMSLLISCSITTIILYVEGISKAVSYGRAVAPDCGLFIILFCLLSWRRSIAQPCAGAHVDERPASN